MSGKHTEFPHSVSMVRLRCSESGESGAGPQRRPEAFRRVEAGCVGDQPVAGRPVLPGDELPHSISEMNVQDAPMLRQAAEDEAARKVAVASDRISHG